MKQTVGRIQQVVVWLGVPSLGLLSSSLLSAQEPKLRASLKGHTSLVISLAYCPDSKTLASGSVDKTIRLWDVKTGKIQATLKGDTDPVYSLAYSPDGKTLASGRGEQ